MVETISFTRRNLPHWLVAERTYFITMRINNSLPSNILQELRNEREQLSKEKDNNEEKTSSEDVIGRNSITLV